ncbi:MAG: hypothetical protein JWL87_171 [Candidatus Adlerbacteria bacterium]|nr:hypothetical protein [Candidatus Adlerbacteria bacterium]
MSLLPNSLSCSQNSKLSMALAILAACVSVLFLAVPYLAKAEAPFNDDFDLYTNGNIKGQGNWVAYISDPTGPNPSVISSGCVSGKCMEFNSSSYATISNDGATTTKGVWNIDFYVSSNPPFDGDFVVAMNNPGVYSGNMGLFFTGRGVTGYNILNPNFQPIFENISTSTWHTLTLSYDISDGGLCSFTLDVDHSGSPEQIYAHPNCETDSHYVENGLTGLVFGSSGSAPIYRVDNIFDADLSNPFYSKISNTPSGTLALREDPDTSADILKILPEDWIVYVSSTTNQTDGYVVADGYRWYEVSDPTDGIEGWMVGANASGTVSYLPYDSINQAALEASSTNYIATSSRPALILKAIDHYYNNANSNNSLYDSDNGSNNISDLKDGDYEKKVVWGIAAHENGGATFGFNNENVSPDYGHGAMQITFNAWFYEPSNPHSTYDNRGYGSFVTIPPCASINTDDYINCYTNAGTHHSAAKHYKPYGGNSSNPTYKQYSNTEQSFYANIKDGMGLLSDRFNLFSYINSTSTVFGTTYSPLEKKIILTTESYNGDNCPYIGLIADVLDDIDTYYPSATTSDIIPLIDKMHATEVSTTTCAQLHSPAELSIYSQKGEVAGVIHGEIKNTFPLAIVNKEQKLVKVLAAEDNYFYKVVGTDKGTYGLDIAIRVGGKLMQFDARNIPTKIGEAHIYSIDAQGLSEGRSDSVFVQVDNEGDGKIDRAFKTGATLNSAEFSNPKTLEQEAPEVEPEVEAPTNPQ